MKKLTTGLLVLVLSSSIAVAHAQEKNDTIKTKEIEGVVVTALGIKREKKSLGYASEEVKAEALTGGTTNTGNVAGLLSGKVAGLQVNTNNNFGGSSNLLIRGYKSLSGGSPLIVIDGSPVNNGSVKGTVFDYGNFLSDINQNDIESINVLKGAAASALYGERGSDGVILIVTKNGRGKQDGSWGVTLNSNINVGFIDKSTFLNTSQDMVPVMDRSMEMILTETVIRMNISTMIRIPENSRFLLLKMHLTELNLTLAC